MCFPYVTALLTQFYYFSTRIADIVMEEAPSTPTLALPTQTPTFPSVISPSPPATVAPTAPLPPPPTTSSQATSPQAVPPQAAPLPDRESRRSGSVGGRMGLTKEVLSAHTQQEEQAFLHRFKDLSKLRVFDQTASSALRCHAPNANPLARGRRQAAAREFRTCTQARTHTHTTHNTQANLVRHIHVCTSMRFTVPAHTYYPHVHRHMGS